MKDRVERFIAKLFLPVERCQILRYEVSAVAGQILKVTRAKIVNHRNTRVRNLSCKASVRFEPMKPAPPVTMKLEARAS